MARACLSRAGATSTLVATSRSRVKQSASRARTAPDSPPPARCLRCCVLLGLACVQSALADTTVHDFGSSSFDLSHGFDPVRYGWSSSDALIAEFGVSGSIGHISGGENVVVIPGIKVLGNTIVPEVRRDTRSGLRLSSSVEGYAGVVLDAGMTVGGAGINATIQAGPRLTLPTAVRAGQPFRLVGETVLGSNFVFDPALPALDAALDVRIGGSASGTVEYGLFPVTGYEIGRFDLNFPEIDLALFDFDLDFNLPRLPDFNFLDLSGLIPESDKDTALYRKKLPPDNALLSAGEVVLVNPSSSALTTQTVEDNAIVSTTRGDLLRVGLDLDGLASYAVSDVSFTGLEFPIKVGEGSQETELARLTYDLIDIKYGLELGYEIETTIDSWLDVTLDFLDENGAPVDVLIREGATLSRASTYTGRWDRLPELTLLSPGDLQLAVDFTGMQREISQRASLTLGDYMELAVFEAQASLKLGIGKQRIGPLFYQKLELAGEFAGIDLYDFRVTLSELGLSSGLWDGALTLEGMPTQDAYLADTGAGIALDNLRRMDTHAVPQALEETLLIIGRGDDTLDTRAQLAPLDYVDPGRQRAVTAQFFKNDFPFPRLYEKTFGHIADPFTFTELDGLHVPEGSTYRIGETDAQRFRLRAVENDGRITGDGYLGFNSIGADGLLLIEGTGSVAFNSAGEVSGGLVVQGEHHQLAFNAVRPFQTGFGDAVSAEGALFLDVTSGDTPAYYADEVNGGNLLTRTLRATLRLENAGGILVDHSALMVDTPELLNERTGEFRARNGAQLALVGDVRNEGLIAATGPGTLLQVDSDRIAGAGDAARPGRFSVSDGATLRFAGTAANDFTIAGALEVITGIGSATGFAREIRLSKESAGSPASALNLVVEEGGSLTLNGLLRLPDSGLLTIDNHGLIDIVSGVNSLRQRCDPDTTCSLPPRIEPIDLVNEGVVQIHAGATFAFDVAIVDYDEGGASLGGGEWRVLGANVPFVNTQPAASSAQIARLDVAVSKVFGNADTFADLTFDERVDEQSGEVELTGISGLDTTLAFNDTRVTLAGAAHFPFFNTVRVNRGTLNLLDQQQFHTASSYENRGGVTTVTNGAGLHVHGALIVNGGSVSFSGNSRFSVAGAMVTQEDDSTAWRDIEVNGGTLGIAEGTVVGDGLLRRDAGPVDYQGTDGLWLNAGRSWIVRDVVEKDAAGAEILTPGVIDLGVRSLAGAYGVVRSDADVLISGGAARFDALESSLRLQHGSLTLENGAAYHAPVGYFFNYGTLELQGAQFTLAHGEFRNYGALSVGADSFLEVQGFTLMNGTVEIEGVVNAEYSMIDSRQSALALAGGVFNSRRIDMMGPVALDFSGGTLLTEELNGSLRIEDATFAPGMSAGEARLFGDYEQMPDGTLRIELDLGGKADSLYVMGQARLDGTLELSLLNGYVPEIGSSFEFLMANALLGDFDYLQGFGSRDGRLFALRRAGSSLFIDVAAVPLPPALWLLGGALGLLLPAVRRRSRAAARSQAA